jgi:hypothetical protein
MSTRSTGIEALCDAEAMTEQVTPAMATVRRPVLMLVARLHVDLLRVSSAACLPAA